MFLISKRHNTRSCSFDDKRVFYGLPQPHDDIRYEIKMFEGDEFIGALDVVKTRFGFYEIHSFVSYRYRNCGYGIKLYSKAIEFAKEKQIELRSSTCFSEAAKRVWKSKRLRQQHKIKRCGKRYRAIETSNKINA